MRERAEVDLAQIQNDVVLRQQAPLQDVVVPLHDPLHEPLPFDDDIAKKNCTLDEFLELQKSCTLDVFCRTLVGG